MDDIVDDDVLPYLSLAVDGLTEAAATTGQFELRPEDVANDSGPDAVLPATGSAAEQLEVYGWESSVWRKLKGYIGF